MDSMATGVRLTDMVVSVASTIWLHRNQLYMCFPFNSSRLSAASPTAPFSPLSPPPQLLVFVFIQVSPFLIWVSLSSPLHSRSATSSLFSQAHCQVGNKRLQKFGRRKELIPE
ncbi:hypothetical protein Y1Q_0001828 [Alligator mississippiensis]|uniref:Uncharacterized protein n=1 Tax=Alligator mississippiensis TaxID=8496 RepID=A0A151MKZ8_ALLMI|nr:hypothetical protein Y1Q_0001828 [Alligator mississippiensis]